MPISELSIVELAEVQNRQLMAAYLARIENAKLTNKSVATDMVRYVERSNNCRGRYSLPETDLHH